VDGTYPGNLLAPLVIMGLAAALITASFRLGSALGLAVFSGIAASRTSHLLAARTPPPATPRGTRHARRVAPAARPAASSLTTGPAPPMYALYYNCNMQTLAGAQDAGGQASGSADPAAVDAVLTASRSLIALATRSLGAAAEETTIAQYRALVVLASRGPQRISDLAGALEVAPSTAGRMCDRLVRKGLIRRHRAREDRRAVLVSITAAGRQVVDQATERRRELIARLLARLSPEQQRAAADALRAFADVTGEIPDSQWPAGPAAQAAVPRARVRRAAHKGAQADTERRA
jgi:DNA-binding MarR family transcriptional regulator